MTGIMNDKGPLFNAFAGLVLEESSVVPDNAAILTDAAGKCVAFTTLDTKQTLVFTGRTLDEAVRIVVSPAIYAEMQRAIVARGDEGSRA